MTHNPLMSRERVIVPPRKPPTKAQMALAWSRENGVCYLCGKPVAHKGPGVEYDHRDGRAVSADDSTDNLYPVHAVCHAPKSHLVDTPRAAKTKRQAKLTEAKERKRSSLSHPFLRKKMDGSVVRR